MVLCLCMDEFLLLYQYSVTFPPAGLLLKFLSRWILLVILTVYTGKYGSPAIANILCYANVAMWECYCCGCSYHGFCHKYKMSVPLLVNAIVSVAAADTAARRLCL